jgi:hypothetical protein
MFRRCHHASRRTGTQSKSRAAERAAGKFGLRPQLKFKTIGDLQRTKLRDIADG